MAYSALRNSGYASCFSYKSNCMEDATDVGEIANEIDGTSTMKPVEYFKEPEVLSVQQNTYEQQQSSLHLQSKFESKLKIIDNRYLQPNFFCPLLLKSSAYHSADGTDSSNELVDSVEVIDEPNLLTSSRSETLDQPSENLMSESYSSATAAKKRIPLRLINNTYSQLHFFLPQMQKVSSQ